MDVETKNAGLGSERQCRHLGLAAMGHLVVADQAAPRERVALEAVRKNNVGNEFRGKLGMEFHVPNPNESPEPVIVPVVRREHRAQRIEPVALRGVARLRGLRQSKQVSEDDRACVTLEVTPSEGRTAPHAVRVAANGTCILRYSFEFMIDDGLNVYVHFYLPQ